MAKEVLNEVADELMVRAVATGAFLTLTAGFLVFMGATSDVEKRAQTRESLCTGINENLSHSFEKFSSSLDAVDAIAPSNQLQINVNYTPEDGAFRNYDTVFNKSCGLQTYTITQAVDPKILELSNEDFCADRTAQINDDLAELSITEVFAHSDEGKIAGFAQYVFPDNTGACEATPLDFN